ncbi:MAG: hypothetical protein AAGD38_03330 [Acidobacteriota bacterium]
MAASARLTSFNRITLFVLVVLSWVSGVGFFVLDSWITVEGDFGPEKHPWQFSVLKIHGAVAFLLMIAFGHLLASHVPPGWRVRTMRPLGIALLVGNVILIVTAYLLYYLGDESLRLATSYTHTVVGVLFPLLLIAHLAQRSRMRRKRRRRAQTSTTASTHK